MHTLPADELTRLAGILGLLGSDHDGEVVAAARAATRRLQAAGVTWHDLLLPAPSPRQIAYMPLDWRTLAAHCARHSGRMTPREALFITELRCGRQHRLTARQMAWLQRIAAKLTARPASR